MASRVAVGARARGLFCRVSNRLRHVVLRIEVFGSLLITQLEESRACQCAAASSLATSAGASASSWARTTQPAIPPCASRVLSSCADDRSSIA